jgi:hypothetical protein
VTETGGPAESTVSERGTSTRVRSSSLPSQKEALLHGSVPGVYRLRKRHFYTGPFPVFPSGRTQNLRPFELLS